MRKVFYNKLIRDEVELKMRNLGIAFEVKKLNNKDFIKSLADKISEEALGVSRSKNKKELLQELADLEIVLDEFKKVMKINTFELRLAKKENLKNKGGFLKKLWLVWSEDNGYKSNERESKKKVK